jgi:hypothetical protein
MVTRKIDRTRYAVTGVPADAVHHFLPTDRKVVKISTAFFDPNYHIVKTRKIRRKR